jgi:SPP1 gp7 family putative phage head morphogenesis protein
MPETVKNPLPLKTTEREFEEAFAGMVRLMSRMYKNQVLGALQQQTINKFADAQTGNYASVFLKLSRGVERKLRARFSEDRIKGIVEKYLSETDKRNKALFYNQIQRAVGIDSKQLAREEGLKATTNALILETTQWANKLRDETLELYTANSLRAMSLGQGIDEVMAQFGEMEGKRIDHAKFTARNQIGNFNAIIGKTRAENLGITQAIWRTSQDERVRPCHEDRDGKVFDLKEGLYSSCDGQSLIPGIDFQCRCVAEYVIPEDDEE